ncbi:MAG: caspase domain-containing protein, partial [Alphaproteobacteria bacterium]
MTMIARRWFAGMLASLVLVAAGHAAVQPRGEGPRIALVIGNAAYAIQPLRNPTNDARAMSAKLREVGFEVDGLYDAGFRDMTRAITSFGRRAAASRSTALFYFAGHGFQINGRNYLVPVDADISSESSAMNESVDVDRILQQFSGAAGHVGIVILDACRNNPFESRFRSSSGGLAQVDAPKGMLIAYATAPGKLAADGDGSNGLYTAALLKALDVPGLRVEDVFKSVRIEVSGATADRQVPWESSSLVGDFQFRRSAPAVAALPPPAVEKPPTRPFDLLQAKAMVDARDHAAVDSYDAAPSPKSLAFSGDRRAFFFDGLSSLDPNDASRRALQRCEFHTGAPCSLYAQDRSVVSPSRNTARAITTRPDGRFDPELVPFVSVRHRPSLERYLREPSPKAMAIAPDGAFGWR